MTNHYFVGLARLGPSLEPFIVLFVAGTKDSRFSDLAQDRLGQRSKKAVARLNRGSGKVFLFLPPLLKWYSLFPICQTSRLYGLTKGIVVTLQPDLRTVER